MPKDTTPLAFLTDPPVMGTLSGNTPELAATGLRAGDTVWGEKATTLRPGELAILRLITDRCVVRLVEAFTSQWIQINGKRLPHDQVITYYRITDVRRDGRGVRLKLNSQHRRAAIHQLTKRVGRAPTKQSHPTHGLQPPTEKGKHEMKSNHKTPAAQSLPAHLEEIAQAIRKKVDGQQGRNYDANAVIRRKVSRLATLAGTRRLVNYSATFRRAMTALQGKELPLASERREVKTAVAVIARWLDLAHILPAPDLKQRRRQPKRIKGVRRIKVNGNWLEEYGIEMNDRLLVAMTGDVRAGELGYFEFRQAFASGARYCHRAFFFLAERNGTCREHAEREGVCLRTYANRCAGLHIGAEGQGIANTLPIDGRKAIILTHSAVFFGRVVGAERDGKAVDTTLPILRPYDEREEATMSLADVPWPENKTPPRTQESKPEDSRLSELRARLAALDEEDEQILRGTERFRLEKEIYDLEHEQDIDEWPDVIGG
jgi:hypothetical protein